MTGSGNDHRPGLERGQSIAEVKQAEKAKACERYNDEIDECATFQGAIKKGFKGRRLPFS
jgi:hypothetical protein